MYRRSTRNKILISALILVIVLFMSSNKPGYADTNIITDIFAPFELILEQETPLPTHSPAIPENTPESVTPQPTEITPESQAPTPTPSENKPAATPTPTPTPLPTATSTTTPASTPTPTPTPNDGTNGKVFIYHTHTTEAYLKSESDRDINLAGRSDNANITVKAAGEALKDKLISLGIDTDHNTTNNEAGGYNSAYKTSYITVDNAIKENGQYIAYLDVHRDAFIKGTTPTVTIDGISVARIMLVVGGNSPHADKNHEFAKKMMAELNKIHPKLCEKVLYVADSAYNKINADNCVIVEIGDNNVTTAEAQRAAEYVAIALAKVLNG